MPTDTRVRFQVADSMSRALTHAARTARRLAKTLRNLAPAVQAPTEEDRKARRRAAYHRRTRLPGSPRSKQWRAGTRRTKHHARRNSR